jgi:hypothetical protein
MKVTTGLEGSQTLRGSRMADYEAWALGIASVLQALGWVPVKQAI